MEASVTADATLHKTFLDFRKKQVFFIFLVFLFALSSCRREEYCTWNVHNQVDSTKTGKIKSVLILGNSIVRHGPKPEAGWNNDWGMAASAADSDFVHILIRNIRQRDTAVTVRFHNIAGFENNFTSYPLSSLDSLKNPDMLIMRVSENVNEKKAADSNFIAYYNTLINYINHDKKAVIVIVDGFWRKGIKHKRCLPGPLDRKNVNDMLAIYAIRHNYPFITTTDLSGDITNQAAGQYENPGVAMHPSDKGMRLIAERIWAYIKNYF